VGDYYFKHTHEDVQLLAGMAKICAAAHTPFIAAADPGVMRMDSWGELAGPSDLAQIFDTPAHAAWNALRESEDSRFLGLTLPRFLGRIPYGASTKKVEEFNFEEFEEAGVDRENGPVSEDADSTRSGNYLWVNAAYAMAANINRAFKRHGWCTQIRGPDDSAGGKVEGLPVYHFPTDDGGVDMTCPTEIAITDRREKELADCGFMPLSHYKNTNHAVFMGAQSLQKPAQYDDADATASANLMARLPYVFAVSRFAHYLKCIAREQIGTFKEREDMQKLLQRWINRYVEPNPEMASDLDKARKPLAAAEIKVEEVEGNPGYYTSRFWLRPHYQLEGLTARLSMVSTLPSVKK
jgi:type VI secretion system protein ImpC